MKAQTTIQNHADVEPEVITTKIAVDRPLREAFLAAAIQFHVFWMMPRLIGWLEA